MLLASEFGTGQVFWSILWFFLFFMWIMLVFNVIGDIFRSDDLSGISKAIWTLVIIFLPFLGIFVYLIARGDKMGKRQIEAAQQQEAALQSYIRQTAGGTSAADQLQSLADLHTAGKLSDEEYAAAKGRVISG
jgi:hypothetical protein